MLRIDEAILDANKYICENICTFGLIDRGLLSQNILGNIRNFVESVAIKILSEGDDIDPNNYDAVTSALKNIKKRGDLQFLYKFHKMLQKSVSHYMYDKDVSERLMLKYYEYLIKIKLYLKQMYDFDILENINEFPLNIDTELYSYYAKIAEIIESPSKFRHNAAYNDRYYVQKIKPFFVDQKIYYEVTFTVANSNTSKFDRAIAFTKYDIVSNYAVKFSIHNDIIRIFGRDIPILVIDDNEVSIRPCEFDNFSKIFDINCKHVASSNEYKKLMEFLSIYKISLEDLVSSDRDYYDFIKNRIISQSNSINIYNLLDRCRDIIIRNKPGANILRYLLHNMNNRIIKFQYNGEQCHNLSDLYLDYRCIPFDHMPYCTSLRQHNPRIYDLLESIPIDRHEHELFARYIKNNTEIDGHLFTPKSTIDEFKDIDGLIRKYNASLYYKHTGRRLEEYKDHIYIKGYVEDSTEIIKKLKNLASSGVYQYTSSVDSWISRKSYEIDDDCKKQSLRYMFAESHVALIYGSAGTGKSTLINHISNFWANNTKIFLANTHPAVDNMRRKVTAGNSDYDTIAKFLSDRYYNTDCDILFIDECSTVSNNDMRKVLEKANFKLLVLVGDIYQIESIYFGNWFSIAKKFVPRTSIFELVNPYRTNNDNLLKIWDRVRNIDDSILEILVKSKCVSSLDESIFEHSDDDEIILCLNYDGLYGINNINRFLQSSNPNKAVTWGTNTYKIEDPVLFNESNIFSPLIHNNSKGKIVGIHPYDNSISFEIELDKSINYIDSSNYDFDLIGKSENGNSIISFSINKYRNTDEDDDDNNSTVVPFQISYAVSIHKAQGLEYNSVKIVITNEIEERITHNIFYTAITRAKNKLKIYWSPETEQYVISRFESKNYNKDAYMLSQLSSLTLAQ